MDSEYDFLAPPILYYDALNAHARSCYMLIKILNINVELQSIDEMDINFEDTYTWINSYFKLPKLVDGNISLCNGHSILIYLCRKYGTENLPNLCPCNYIARQKITSMLFYEGCILHRCLSHLLTDIFLAKYPNFNVEYHMCKVCNVYNSLNTFLNGHSYMIGNSLTIADISILSSVSVLNTIFPIDYEMFPKLFDWFQRLKKKEFYNCNDEGIQKLRYLLKNVCNFPFPSPFTIEVNGETKQRNSNASEEREMSYAREVKVAEFAFDKENSKKKSRISTVSDDQRLQPQAERSQTDKKKSTGRLSGFVFVKEIDSEIDQRQKKKDNKKLSLVDKRESIESLPQTSGYEYVMDRDNNRPKYEEETSYANACKCNCYCCTEMTNTRTSNSQHLPKNNEKKQKFRERRLQSWEDLTAVDDIPLIPENKDSQAVKILYYCCCKKCTINERANKMRYFSREIANISNNNEKDFERDRSYTGSSEEHETVPDKGNANNARKSKNMITNHETTIDAIVSNSKHIESNDLELVLSKTNENNFAYSQEVLNDRILANHDKSERISDYRKLSQSLSKKRDDIVDQINSRRGTTDEQEMDLNSIESKNGQSSNIRNSKQQQQATGEPQVDYTFKELDYRKLSQSLSKKDEIVDQISSEISAKDNKHVDLSDNESYNGRSSITRSNKETEEDTDIEVAHFSANKAAESKYDPRGNSKDETEEERQALKPFCTCKCGKMFSSIDNKNGEEVEVDIAKGKPLITAQETTNEASRSTKDNDNNFLNNQNVEELLEKVRKLEGMLEMSGVINRNSLLAATLSRNSLVATGENTSPKCCGSSCSCNIKSAQCSCYQLQTNTKMDSLETSTPEPIHTRSEGEAEHSDVSLNTKTEAPITKRLEAGGSPNPLKSQTLNRNFPIHFVKTMHMQNEDCEDNVSLSNEKITKIVYLFRTQNSCVKQQDDCGKRKTVGKSRIPRLMPKESLG